MTAPRIERLPLAKALTAGLRAALEEDPRVLVMGEDVGVLGGVFRVTDGLLKDFGEDRVVDTPLAESGILGTAIGLAMRGYRPVCEIQFDGFVFPAFNQITTQLAKLRYRSRGAVTVPLVIRIPYGGGIGAVEHHSESPEIYFAHTPGLRVVAPATPADAFVMIQQAIASPDPVVFLEPKRRYWDKADVDLATRPATAPWDLHASRIVRPGTDVTVVAHGAMVHTVLAAAAAAADEATPDGTAGADIEVVDLRSLAPLDLDPVIDSVRRTGRLVVAHEAPLPHGIGAEVAARIQEECFHLLEAPVVRVGGWATPYPPSRLESLYLPDAHRVLDAVDRVLAY
ncbi:MAG: alpha-ketoacid dehydrogenase subunit beta [Kineosporiaceae bacterium]